MIIGYARVSTNRQDLTAQVTALKEMGAEERSIHVDEGFTGSNRSRPGLEKALASVRDGDVFAVTKLDRLARSIRDARDIADEVVGRGAKLRIGGSMYDPNDPMGKLMFNMLATFAEFEADLIRMRTREGMQVAKAKGRLRGKKPKLSKTQETHLVALYRAGAHTTSQLAAEFGVARSTVYRAVERAGGSS